MIIDDSHLLPANPHSYCHFVHYADGCNQFGVITGVHQEGVYSANINGGLFSAFIDNGKLAYHVLLR
jgi:hypothetical protein